MALTSCTVEIDARTKARMQGFEGDPCGECGNGMLMRNGIGPKRDTCGAGALAPDADQAAGRKTGHYKRRA